MILVNDHHSADCENSDRGLASIMLRIAREVIYLALFARTSVVTRETVEGEAAD